MTTDLLDPCNDYVFKRLFAVSPVLLADLINAVRSEEPRIEVVEVLNPRIEPEELAGKFVIGELHKSEAPEYTAEYDKMIARLQGKGAEA